MHIFPHNKQEWLGAVLFPFKAYTVIGPLMFFVSDSFPHHHHSGATWAEGLYLFSLIPCAAFLLFAALILALVGPKGSALPCVAFAAADLIIAYVLLPNLASA